MYKKITGRKKKKKKGERLLTEPEISKKKNKEDRVQ